MNGKSATTIATFISRCKDLFKYLNKQECVLWMNLGVLKELTDAKQELYGRICGIDGLTAITLKKL